jgi:hypothetical protein
VCGWAGKGHWLVGWKRGTEGMAVLSLKPFQNKLHWIYPKECAPEYARGTCTPMFTAALFTIAKLWKQLRCPTTEAWIKKMWYLYTVEFYSTIKKNEIMLSAGKWMALEDFMLSEVGQA